MQRPAAPHTHYIRQKTKKSKSFEKEEKERITKDPPSRKGQPRLPPHFIRLLIHISEKMWPTYDQFGPIEIHRQQI